MRLYLQRIIYTRYFFQMLSILRHNQHLYQLRKTLIPWFNKLLKDEKDNEIILKQMRLFFLPARALFMCIIFFSSLHIFVPGILITKQWIAGEYPIEYEITVPTMFDIEDGGIIFIIEYVHAMTAAATVTIGTSMDLLFVYFTFILNKLLWVGAKKIAAFKINDRNEKEFYSIIQEHQKIRKHIFLINEIYEIPVFTLFLSSSFVLCTISYQLSAVSNFSLNCLLMALEAILIRAIQVGRKSKYVFKNIIYQGK